MWGVVEALRAPRADLLSHTMLNPHHAGAAAAATAPRQSGKLLLNQILNHVTRRGPFLGNSAGVLAMTYNLMNAYHPRLLICLGFCDGGLMLAGGWKRGRLFRRL
jgi:hypothetical protein